MFTIRAYSDEDRDSVIELVKNLKKCYPSINNWVKREIKRIEKNESKCWLAQLDHNIVGIALSSLIEYPEKNRVVKLKTFYLRNDSRHFGIGSFLLNYVIDH